MPKANNKIRFNYLSANNRDYEWGIVVTTIGCQRIAPHSQYPAPKEHPSIYEFSTDKGRILHEYQIIYILDGGGQFESAHQKLVSVNSGDFILLFPGEWHNYHPNQETGWYEHWLGFSGSYADQLVKNGFLSVTNPIINVGHSTELKNLFSMAISYTLEQPSGYQQLLSGIVQFALGLCFVQSQRIRFKNAEIVDKINHARQIMGERYNEEFSMESIAKKGENYDGGGSYMNLFCAHPPFLIDGNFGGLSGMNQMLLQSHDQAITLLPALPDAWDKGSVKGLRARGGFELGIHWIGRSLQKATVISLRGEPCTLRTTVPIKVKGISVVSQPEFTDFGKWYITTFPTTQGRIYEIQPAISVK